MTPTLAEKVKRAHGAVNTACALIGQFVYSDFDPESTFKDKERLAEASTTAKAAAHAAIDSLATSLTPAPSEGQEERAQRLRTIFAREVGMPDDEAGDVKGWLAVADAAPDTFANLVQYISCGKHPEAEKAMLQGRCGICVAGGVDARKVREALRLMKCQGGFTPGWHDKAISLLEEALAKETK